MDRRGFLRLLGMGAAAAVAPTKAYSFLGGILRPRPGVKITLVDKSALVIPGTQAWLDAVSQQVSQALFYGASSRNEVWDAYEGLMERSQIPIPPYNLGGYEIDCLGADGKSITRIT